MAHYSVALGGNKRNFPQWDELYSSGNSAGNIKYTPHHAVREFVLPLDFNGSHNDWAAYFNMTLPTKKPEVNDTFDWYFLNEGTEVHRLVVHNKRAAAVVLEFQGYDSTGAMVGSAITADLNTVGYTGLGEDLKQKWVKNGFMRVKLVSGDMREACFSTFIKLTDFNSAKECGCAPVICDVETPAPGCFTPTPQV